jgi:hypothetical protein
VSSSRLRLRLRLRVRELVAHCLPLMLTGIFSFVQAPGPVDQFDPELIDLTQSDIVRCISQDLGLMGEGLTD